MQLVKYLIIAWQGHEQAVTFPSNVQHAVMLNHIRRQSPEVKALSAGFFVDEPDAFWHGGESETLRLRSRPQDGLLIQTMTQSRERRLWDLRVLVWEACEAARLGSTIHRMSHVAMNI